MKNLAAFIFLKNYGAARKYTLILNRKKIYGIGVRYKYIIVPARNNISNYFQKYLSVN
jgi:hypothetical protein